MFRKYYKEAMDDIKPSEEFVNSVIANAMSKKPPAYRRYMRYAVPAAAAVVVVSAAVISMPMWQRVDTDDGIIIEEAITETAAPEAASSSPVPVASAPVAASTPASAQVQTPPPVKVQRSVPSAASESVEQSEGAAPEEESMAEVNDGLDSVVEDTGDYEVRVEAVPYEADNSASTSGAMAPFSAAEAPSAKKARVEDSDIPAPSGYYCTSASPNGYTFVNDSGAVIVVTVGFGGEESEPYIEEDGDNIYAAFNSFGMSVTINASGADRTAVEEIINSLR